MVQIATTPSTSGPAPVADMEPLPSVPGETPPSDAISKERFASALDRSGDHKSGGLAAPLSPNSLHAGRVIAASRISGLKSELPGMVTAKVTQNELDTETGSMLWVPQGER